MNTDVEWRKEWFVNIPSVPNSYWKSLRNQKQFLDELARNLNIKRPSDWGKLTTRSFSECGGKSILSNYYDGSLFKCLQSVYSGFFPFFFKFQRH